VGRHEWGVNQIGQLIGLYGWEHLWWLGRSS